VGVIGGLTHFLSPDLKAHIATLKREASVDSRDALADLAKQETLQIESRKLQDQAQEFRDKALEFFSQAGTATDAEQANQLVTQANDFVAQANSAEHQAIDIMVAIRALGKKGSIYVSLMAQLQTVQKGVLDAQAAIAKLQRAIDNDQVRFDTFD